MVCLSPCTLPFWAVPAQIWSTDINPHPHPQLDASHEPTQPQLLLSITVEGRPDQRQQRPSLPGLLGQASEPYLPRMSVNGTP